jgi:hypothetical protein
MQKIEYRTEIYGTISIYKENCKGRIENSQAKRTGVPNTLKKLHCIIAFSRRMMIAERQSKIGQLKQRKGTYAKYYDSKIKHIFPWNLLLSECHASTTLRTEFQIGAEQF